MKRYCLALDLKNDEDLIRQYEDHHKAVWAEVIAAIKESGIIEMEIYRVETRLFMIMETEDEFCFERKNQADQANERVMAWEKLMSTYQQAIPGAKPGEKWRLMEKIFQWKNKR